MTDNLSATGNIDYNRSSVKQDYNVPYFDQYGNKVFEDRGSIRDVYKSPVDVRLGFNYQTPQTNANISVNPRTRDLMARYNYSFADGGRAGYADGSFVDDFIKNNIGPEYRLYARTMIPGFKTGKLDENYFPDDFKLDLRKQALEKYSRTGDLSGQVNEKDQHLTRSSRQNAITKFPSTYATLGTYSYEIDPKTLDVKVKDKYDWNPAYGTQGNFTGWIGNDNPKARDVDTSLIKDYISNSFKNKRVDTSAGLEMLGNLLGPRASKGEGVDIDINIPTEFSAMRADTPYADGGQVKTHLTRTIPPVKGPMSQGVETLFKRRYN